MQCSPTAQNVGLPAFCVTGGFCQKPQRDVHGHRRHLQPLAVQAQWLEWDLFGCIRSLPSSLWWKVFLPALTAPQPLGEAHDFLGSRHFLFVLQASSRHGTEAIFISVFVTSWQQLQFWELKCWLEVERMAQSTPRHVEIRVEEGKKEGKGENHQSASSPRKLVVFPCARCATCPPDGCHRVHLCETESIEIAAQDDSNRTRSFPTGCSCSGGHRAGEGESPGWMIFCATCLAAHCGGGGELQPFGYETAQCNPPVRLARLPPKAGQPSTMPWQSALPGLLTWLQSHAGASMLLSVLQLASLPHAMQVSRLMWATSLWLGNPQGARVGDLCSRWFTCCFPLQECDTILSTFASWLDFNGVKPADVWGFTIAMGLEVIAGWKTVETSSLCLHFFVYPAAEASARHGRSHVCKRGSPLPMHALSRYLVPLLPKNSGFQESGPEFFPVHCLFSAPFHWSVELCLTEKVSHSPHLS